MSASLWFLKLSLSLPSCLLISVIKWINKTWKSETNHWSKTSIQVLCLAVDEQTQHTFGPKNPLIWKEIGKEKKNREHKKMKDSYFRLETAWFVVRHNRGNHKVNFEQYACISEL